MNAEKEIFKVRMTCNDSKKNNVKSCGAKYTIIFLKGSTKNKYKKNIFETYQTGLI